VNVVLGLARRVEVDDVADAGHVDAARGHVGGDQHTHATVAKTLQREVPLALVHVAVQCPGGETLRA